LELLGRYDGNYIYARGKRWGLFPGVTTGWVVSEEDFEDRNSRKMIMLNWEEKYSLYTKSYSITIAC